MTHCVIDTVTGLNMHQEKTLPKALRTQALNALTKLIKKKKQLKTITWIKNCCDKENRTLLCCFPIFVLSKVCLFHILLQLYQLLGSVSSSATNKTATTRTTTTTTTTSSTTTTTTKTTTTTTTERTASTASRITPKATTTTTQRTALWLISGASSGMSCSMEQINPAS